MTSTPQLKARPIEISGDCDAVNQWLYRQGLTDGLPVVPPTAERIRNLLQATSRPPDEELGAVPPRWGVATVEKVAINAVMAGCQPEYFPVLLAAVEAMLEPQFNLYGIQATTHCLGPALMVNGPIARELDINSANNCFGPGWRANATIGRALRLVLLNIGGGIPGQGDKATAGWPGKYSFCFAENEAQNPWEPLHVERGFPRETSTVTVFAAGGYHNLADLWSTNAEGVLKTIAFGLAAKSSHLGEGGEPLCALCPEHAAIIAKEGLSKGDVKVFLYQHALVPLSVFGPEVQAEFGRRGSPTPEGMLRIADRPQDILVVVAGGPGPHSAFIPSWGRTVKSVTKAIKEPKR